MYVLSDDQALFKDVVVRFFSEQSSVEAVRKLMESPEGYDVDVWRLMSSDLGLPGLHIPEQYGGFGFGMVELGIVLEAMGKHLYSGPFFSSSVMAASALLKVADEEAKLVHLPGIANGEEIAVLVIDDVGDLSKWGHGLKVESSLLSGCAEIVLDAGIASQFYVIASSEDGLGLFEILDKGKMTIQPREVIDPTRKLSRLRFEGTPVRHLGAINASTARALWDFWSLCLSHEMIGGAQHLLDSTVDYTKLRFQFGRAIGSFQALKHRCAELLMELELAKGVLSDATKAAVEESGELYLPSMAKAMVSDVYLSNAKAAVQLRGGIGFTWENDTHLWFKRAKSSEVFLGTPVAHREHVINMIEESGYAA